MTAPTTPPTWSAFVFRHGRWERLVAGARSSIAAWAAVQDLRVKGAKKVLLDSHPDDPKPKADAS